MKVVVRSAVLIFTLSTLVTLSSAQDSPDYIPASDQFAPIAKARYLSGELVYIDPVNRRGAIRMHDNYWSGPAHYFALLPYATVRYNGAYAELRDLPLGTVVHGYFTVPPKGEENTIPPLPDEHKKAAIPHNHGICLEDDFSFYQRQGQSWKIVSVDIDKEKISVEPTGKKT